MIPLGEVALGFDERLVDLRARLDILLHDLARSLRRGRRFGVEQRRGLAARVDDDLLGLLDRVFDRRPQRGRQAGRVAQGLGEQCVSGGIAFGDEATASLGAGRLRNENLVIDAAFERECLDEFEAGLEHPDEFAGFVDVGKFRPFMGPDEAGAADRQQTRAQPCN